MKDLILIPIIAVVFAFAYHLLMKVDYAFWSNRKWFPLKRRNEKEKVRVAVEHSLAMGAVTSLLEKEIEEEEQIKCVYSTGSAEHLWKRLQRRSLDIALMTKEQVDGLKKKYPKAPISFEKTMISENDADDKTLYVVWKKGLTIRSRDHVLFTLKYDHCKLKSGYVDYAE